MPVLLFPSGRAHHRLARANVISPLLFPHSRHGSAPGVHRCLSHLLSCSWGVMAAARRGVPGL